MQKNIALYGGIIFVLLAAGLTFIVAQDDNNLPFFVNPEEEGDHDGDHQYPDYQGTLYIGENGNEGDLSQMVSISQADAESIALTYTTGGDVISSALENENGYLVWQVIVDFDTNLYEVVIDAGSGQVLWASNE